MTEQTDTKLADKILANKIRRWDDIRRNQLGVAQTTFTALATGGVGYCAQLLANEKVHFSCWASVWFIFASIAFGIGLLTGVFGTWTRFKDARLVASKHHAKKKEGATAEETSQITKKYKFWESVTLNLMRTLVVAVTAGIIFIFCCVVTLYQHKLFSKNMKPAAAHAAKQKAPQSPSGPLKVESKP